jgi:hypothetical protein
MDPVALKKQYGDVLTLHGGINAVLWDDKEAILTEIRQNSTGTEGKRGIHILIRSLDTNSP